MAPKQIAYGYERKTPAAHFRDETRQGANDPPDGGGGVRRGFFGDGSRL